MAIFDVHYPWVFTFGILGNIISIFVYFAPLPTFIRIYKEKSTLGFQSLPYVVGLFSAMLWMYYALLKTNSMLLISINSFGCVIQSIYIILFLLYASNKARKDTGKLLGVLNVGLFAMIFLVTFFTLKGSLRVQVVGWICVVISVCVFAAPLSIVFQVVRTKSVEFLPFTLSFFLTLSAVMWFSYGLLQKDLCIALPNVLGFFLGMIQMLLYGMYRHPKQVVEDKMVQPEHVMINIAMLGSSEVHPIDSQKGDSDNEVIIIAVKEDEKIIEEEKGVEYAADGDDHDQYDFNQHCKVNVQINPPAFVVS